MRRHSFTPIEFKACSNSRESTAPLPSRSHTVKVSFKISPEISGEAALIASHDLMFFIPFSVFWRFHLSALPTPADEQGNSVREPLCQREGEEREEREERETHTQTHKTHGELALT
jgi:hypothetical protein